ncbi:helix-turn-helix domain-containing protein [Nonomuraea phyllanthi]|uniref:Helix-turn-helix domain-containing protein n=1 Tax=Nonomuraea phyllanthi TaxID=2219224 RepID=A0A5C4WKM9_9ACTN|nr:helix-turn-helix transcriptional regulator [Nonomuraea phyllanthi]KAB8194867.1 helix-turn-helix domain-containing protein [Nonomuraea phyllanthi]
MSDNELGAFLRSRREAIRPADVGLPAGFRRRTPGLRRAELATLAGISVEYLARLEQGSDRRPSPQVLGALADALQMSTGERFHLRLLAKAAEGGSLFVCPSAQPPVVSIRPTVQALLDKLEPAPAVLINRMTQILAYTTGFEHLARPIGLLDVAEPSFVWFVFTDPRARDVYPDWDAVATQQVATLKYAAGLADPHVAALADELTVTAGGPFAERLTTPGVPDRAGIQRWTHPQAGELRLAYEALELADDQRLIAYLPADETSSAALDRLADRHPGTLRVVNG